MADQSSTEYVIGKRYLVPCIEVAPDVSIFGLTTFPVLGRKHRDAGLADFEHYHIDWRFVSERAFQRALASSAVSILGRLISNTGPICSPGIHHGTVMRRMTCKRQMPEFPGPADMSRASIRKWREFEADQQQRCARLIDGHTCPHRGLDLRSFALPDGTAICPGHGLRWNLATGELVPRYSIPEPARG